MWTARSAGTSPGADQTTVLSWQLRLSILQTLVLVIAASVGGALSDRTGRRKIFVIASTALAGAGLLVFAFAQVPELLYVAATFFGLTSPTPSGL